MKRTNLIRKVLTALLQWSKKTFFRSTYEDDFDHNNITLSIR